MTKIVTCVISDKIKVSTRIGSLLSLEPIHMKKHKHNHSL